MAVKAGQGIGLLLTLILIVLLVVYVLPLTGNILYTLLINTIVGFIVIFLVNAIFGLGIRYDLLVLIFVAIFGLLAVAILIILNLLGVGSSNSPVKNTRSRSNRNNDE
jgi:phosphoglycerol transferase MdoB-like AlkP superfamily enzyme